MVFKCVLRNLHLLALFLSVLLVSTPVLAKESHLINLQRLIDAHTVKVQQKVANNWTLQSVPAVKVSSVVEVTVSMNGKVTSTRIVSSSGNSEFDRSVEVAVTRSSPLPVAADPEVMDQFRSLQFEFRVGVSGTTTHLPTPGSSLGYSNYARVKSPVYIDK